MYQPSHFEMWVPKGRLYTADTTWYSPLDFSFVDIVKSGSAQGLIQLKGRTLCRRKIEDHRTRVFPTKGFEGRLFQSIYSVLRSSPHSNLVFIIFCGFAKSGSAQGWIFLQFMTSSLIPPSVQLPLETLTCISLDVFDLTNQHLPFFAVDNVLTFPPSSRGLKYQFLFQNHPT